MPAWTEEERARALELWKTHTGEEIAKILGKTRNSVMGFFHRKKAKKGFQPVRKTPAKKVKFKRFVIISREKGTPHPPDHLHPLRDVLTVGPGECRWPLGNGVCGRPVSEESKLVPILRDGGYCEHHLSRYADRLVVLRESNGQKEVQRLQERNPQGLPPLAVPGVPGKARTEGEGSMAKPEPSLLQALASQEEGELNAH